jgi:regulator of RNase E activity RraB
MLHNKVIRGKQLLKTLPTNTMAITLSTTYKTELPADLVEIIDELVEDGQNLEDLLIVVDYFGENYFENFEAILEVLEDTGASNSDLYDFVEEHGVDNLEYFEKYSELRDDYDPAAVDAFISLYDVSDLDNFEEVYEGQFDNVREFVENFLENTGEQIPSWLCIDYEATWNCSLRFDYNEENDYYFRSNW